MSSQTITPMIAYPDGFAALDWLARVFGFRELIRDGRAEDIEGHRWMFMER